MTGALSKTETNNSSGIPEQLHTLAKTEYDLLRHLTNKRKKDKIFVAVLIVVILVGMYAYYRQLRYGLVVTAMRDYISWGIYISNFVFFVELFVPLYLIL